MYEYFALRQQVLYVCTSHNKDVMQIPFVLADVKEYHILILLEQW